MQLKVHHSIILEHAYGSWLIVQHQAYDDFATLQHHFHVGVWAEEIWWMIPIEEYNSWKALGIYDSALSGNNSNMASKLILNFFYGIF